MLNNIRILNINCKKRDTVFKLIAKDALKNKVIKNEGKLIDAFIKREDISTTGFQDGIAIPHANISDIQKTTVYIVRNSSGIDWPSLDNVKTNIAIAILVRKGKSSSNDHMEILSTISKCLLEGRFRELLKTGTLGKIKAFINESTNKKLKLVNKDNPKLNIVGVSACATGVAHTYMAQKTMQDKGTELGYNIKIETQGQKGAENVLTNSDIKNADYVIIAADINVELDRFEGKKIFITTTQEVIKNFDKVLIKLSKESSILKKSNNGDILSPANSRGILSHILSGVSRMIPFIVFSGIVWAILNAVTFSYGNAAKPQVLLLAIKAASVGFTLFIAMMGGFIGESIGGRAAFAPATIATFVAATPAFFWNWGGIIPVVYMKDLAGNFIINNAGDKISLQVGWTIIGAIVCGFAGGYLVLQINKIKVHSLLAPLMPILFIPVVATSLLVFPIVFILGGPVGYIINMLGLGIGIGGQINGVNFLIGFILGAMIGWDMGGPINKIAGATATSLIIVDPRLLGAVEAAIPIAPLGCGLATLLGGKTFTDNEKGLGISALALGFFGISEGAIPFAAKRPKQTFFVNTIASALAGGFAFMFYVGGHVGMWGGPIVAFVLGIYADPGSLGTHIPTLFGGSVPFISILWFFLAIAIGTITHSFMYLYFVRRELKNKKMFTKINLRFLKKNKS